MNRTKKSAKNVMWGLLNQTTILIVGFIVRVFFVKYLGIEFLGLNGLYSNILNVLSLVDLGFGTALIYSLYKPMAESDIKKISGLINLYKKIYLYMQLTILIIGLILIPILPYIIKTNINDYILYYLLYLISTVLSYSFVYKSVLINASQNLHIIQKISLIITIIKGLLQVIVLYLYQNYYLYLLIQILGIIINNILLSVKAKKLYPNLDKNEVLEKKDKKNIVKNIKDLSLYKIAGVSLNYTDNILIAMFAGLITVGIYSNYLMIISAITAITTVIFQGVTASLGNFNTTKDKDKQYELFNTTTFMTYILFGIISICLLLLINDFIMIWLGKEMLLSLPLVILIVLNFYIPGLIRSITLFRDSIGLFAKMKYIYLCTAILNIVLSIVLGIYYGLFGILLATLISRIITHFWYEPYVLIKDYFQKSVINYFIKQISFILITILITIITYFIIKDIVVINIFILILKFIVIVLVSSCLYLLIFCKTKEFKNVKRRINVLKRKKLTNKTNSGTIKSRKKV